MIIIGRFSKQKSHPGIDVTKLPTKLTDPGTKEGETKMVNEPGGVVVYQWTKGNWEKIGDVTGVNKKDTLNGKEYDFIFNIDVEEGRPPIKLGYNLTEDPWRAAQRFMNENAVSIAYLEEVANFIISNTAQAREERAVKER
jgi:phospholipase A-2-activating protein